MTTRKSYYYYLFTAGPDAAAAGGVEYRASGPGGARLLAAEQPPALPRARPQVVQRAPANIDPYTNVVIFQLDIVKIKEEHLECAKM